MYTQTTCRTQLLKGHDAIRWMQEQERRHCRTSRPCSLNVHVRRVGPVVLDVYGTGPAVHRRPWRVARRPGWLRRGATARHGRHRGRMVDTAVVKRVGERRRRRRYVMMMVAGRAGARASRSPGHAWVQTVGKRLLERGHRGRGYGSLPVVEVRGGRRTARARDAAPTTAAGGRRRASRIRPAAVRRPAVQPLERRVVARLGQQFQAHCGLTLPLGPAEQKEKTTNAGLAKRFVQNRRMHVFKINNFNFQGPIRAVLHCDDNIIMIWYARAFRMFTRMITSAKGCDFSVRTEIRIQRGRGEDFRFTNRTTRFRSEYLPTPIESSSKCRLSRRVRFYRDTYI